MTIKSEYFSQTPKVIIDGKIAKIVNDCLKRIKIPALRSAGRRSLWAFYERQYNELMRSFSHQTEMLTALFLLLGKNPNGEKITPTQAQKEKSVEYISDMGYDNIRMTGVPLQRFSQDYINKNVRPALERLAKQYPHDPDDVSGRNSLRNRAEMEVRYQANKDSIADFRSRGIKLVIASSHSDCSKRCAPWQGRVYSLDGTSGTTDDGRKFVPIEEATDHYYTTKAGKTYKNGLLGFNCRHYLVEYKTGYRFPKFNPLIERREYKITQEQRRLERNVREWRIRAVEAKGQDEKTYKNARKKAIEWNQAYIAFSKKYGRAYYPARTKIL